jgi:hypothetical protein
MEEKKEIKVISKYNFKTNKEIKSQKKVLEVKRYKLQVVSTV